MYFQVNQLFFDEEARFDFMKRSATSLTNFNVSNDAAADKISARFILKDLKTLMKHLAPVPWNLRCDFPLILYIVTTDPPNSSIIL